MSETTGWTRDRSRNQYRKTIGDQLYCIERCRFGWYHRTTLIIPQFYTYLAEAKIAAHRHAEGMES